MSVSNAYTNIDLSVIVMYDDGFLNSYPNATTVIRQTMTNVGKAYQGKWNITFSVTTQHISDAPADSCPNKPWFPCTNTVLGCGTSCINSYSIFNHHRNADYNAYYVEDHHPLNSYDIRIYLTANTPCHADAEGNPHKLSALGFAPTDVQNSRNFVWVLNCPSNYNEDYSRGDLLNIRVIQHELSHLFGCGHCSASSDDPCIMTGNSYNFDTNVEQVVDLWCSNCEIDFCRTNFGS